MTDHMEVPPPRIFPVLTTCVHCTAVFLDSEFTYAAGHGRCPECGRRD